MEQVGSRFQINIFPVIACALLAWVCAGCSGGSNRPLLPLTSYSVSGRVLNATGGPLAGVTITLESQTTTTGTDGSYSFIDIPSGFTGTLVPALAELTFEPPQIGVNVTSADLAGQDFTGYALSKAGHDLPSQGTTATALTIRILAQDETGHTITSYDSETGELRATPSGMVVLQHPRFENGTATAIVRFDFPGEYTLTLHNICEALDGELGSLTVTSGTPDQSLIKISQWQGGADAAISLTFDDGTAEHWSRGLPLWEEYGFRVTLGILANRFIDHPDRIPQLQLAVDAGHELANHSLSHPDLTSLSASQIRDELQVCQDLILDNVTGQDQVLTAVYPYETYNPFVISVLQEMGFLFARSGAQDLWNWTPLNDPWNPPYHHLYAWANLNTLTLPMWDDTTDSAVSTGSWLIEECHGIGEVGEPGVGWSPVPETLFRQHYDHIKSFGNQIWVAPVSEVGRYIMERNLAVITISQVTAERVDFTLADNLDDAIFNIPLTLTCTLPDEWTDMRIEQNGTVLPHTEPAAGEYQFSVVPDKPGLSLFRVME